VLIFFIFLQFQARFGTLKDYFDLLDQRLNDETDSDRKDLPILSGDFFTYADRDDHFWSGYFTSRPFYKHMDRTVQHYVRTADILFSLALWKSKQIGAPKLPDFPYDSLVESRRSLSLFQHHDGVTGTARDHVVLDYGRKMLAAINNCSSIISQSTNYLLDIPESNQLNSDQEFYVDHLPKRLKIDVGRFDLKKINKN
jgi:alpha-mannosidase II